jgi:hypothetical protein
MDILNIPGGIGYQNLFINYFNFMNKGLLNLVGIAPDLEDLTISTKDFELEKQKERDEVTKEKFQSTDNEGILRLSHIYSSLSNLLPAKEEPLFTGTVQFDYSMHKKCFTFLDLENAGKLSPNDFKIFLKSLVEVSNKV